MTTDWLRGVGSIMTALLVLAGCSFSLEAGEDAERRAFAQKLSGLLTEYTQVNSSGQQSCLQGPTATCGEAIDRYCAMLENFRAGLDQPPPPPEDLVGQNSNIVDVLEDFLDTCPRAQEAIRSKSASELDQAIAEFQVEHRTLNELASPILSRLNSQDS
jgi:hypothetical protein